MSADPEPHAWANPPPLPYPRVRILEGCLAGGAESALNDQVLLSNEYGKRDTILEIRDALLQFGYQDVQFSEITLANYKDVLAALQQEADDCGGCLVVVNLCDGTETDGYPGISVVNELERRHMAYTGSNPFFYVTTTSKPELKRMLQARHVPTSPFVEISAKVTDVELDEAIRNASSVVGFPMIVKPAVSYASMCITDKSIVHSPADAREQIRRVHEATHEGVFVERFLAGREFTALCTGDAHQGVRVYPVAERVFDARLGTFQRILAFDRYWDGYDLEGGKPASEAPPVYKYARAPEGWQSELSRVAREAYLACGGTGYGRVDMRTPKDGEVEGVQVLEVNANCGMSFDPTASTAGSILNLAHEKPPRFAHSLVAYAIQRQKDDTSKGLL